MPRTVPVIPVELEGNRYLVSSYGESEWVHNLRAAGGCELSRRGHSETFQASEVPADEREAIIAAYRKNVSRAVSRCFTKLLDAKDHPVVLPLQAHGFLAKPATHG